MDFACQEGIGVELQARFKWKKTWRRLINVKVSSPISHRLSHFTEAGQSDGMLGMKCTMLPLLGVPGFLKQ